MARTALSIIKSGMRKAGILSEVESPTSDQSADALETLNDILSSFSNDGLLVYAHTTENFSIYGGIGSYTIGSGGTLTRLARFLFARCITEIALVLIIK